MASPARQLKNVDLPAPFGPISPMMSPSSMARSAPDTARKLPKALETLRASSSMAASPARRRDAVPQIEQPARLESRNQHNDSAVENIGEAGTAATKPSIGRRLQGDKNESAQQGAE